MTARKTNPKAPATEGKAKPKPAFCLEKDQTHAEALAGAIVAPTIRHAHLAQSLSKFYVSSDGAAELGDFADAMNKQLGAGGKGELSGASKMLMAQALTLDGIFTEMARRMAINMGEHLNATEIYARIALKAQAGSRATIEALAKLHQPREQTVRQVHVNEGGQAVIADQFHHHTGGQENGQSNGQPHATGTGPAGTSPALPSPNPLGPAMPLPSGEGQGAVQDARRQG